MHASPALRLTVRRGRVRQISCTADCHIYRQSYLTDPSQSKLEETEVVHGDYAVLPFYNATAVPPGGSCDAVRVYGSCLCNNGSNVPGCKVSK
jgi:hypothetical protein